MNGYFGLEITSGTPILSWCTSLKIMSKIAFSTFLYFEKYNPKYIKKIQELHILEILKKLYFRIRILNSVQNIYFKIIFEYFKLIIPKYLMMKSLL